MAIELGKEVEELIRRRIREGRYRTADEYLRKVIADADEHSGLRDSIAAGINQLDNGKTVPGDEAFERLRARSSRRRREG